MTVKEGLQRALAAFGPNGEKWAKGNEPIKDLTGGFGVGMGCKVPSGFLCAMTSCGKVTGLDHISFRDPAVQTFQDMRAALENALPQEFRKSVVRFNDTPETTFADIKALFERAIAAQEAV